MSSGQMAFGREVEEGSVAVQAGILSEVGQVVLPATPGGSPAAGKRQVNVPLAGNSDLPYGFLAFADSVTDPPTSSRSATSLPVESASLHS